VEKRAAPKQMVEYAGGAFESAGSAITEIASPANPSAFITRREPRSERPPPDREAVREQTGVCAM
tara:strand:+ start:1778 stop:1972 length:195 start_codon:yes stop_codon:yes gene_type:complete